MIRLICFDIDDTLMDFHKGERIAFMETMEQFGIHPNEENYELYKCINQSFWRALEKGEVTKECLKVERFEQLKKETGFEFDAYQLSRVFECKLGEQCFLFEDAMEVVKKSAKLAPLAVTTNGIASIQRNRLNKSGLISYFKYLFISEEIGYSKPQLPYYEEIFRQSGCQPNEIMMIGDSLSADILGAVNSGCVSVWYNPNHLENKMDMKSDYIIDDLNQVFNIWEELS